MRSSNSPVAGYAEFLVATALKLELATKSTKGYDAVSSDGVRYEIKARRPTRHNRSRQLSAIRNLPAEEFDYLAGVLFHRDYSIARGCLIPVETVGAMARYQEHTNAWILHLRDELWNLDEVEDITEQLRSAAAV